HLNRDGTKLYVAGSSGDNINEYTLSVPFDVRSATFEHATSVASIDTAPYDVELSADGTKMFMFGISNDNVYEFTLTTSFDVSTAEYVQATTTDGTGGANQSIAFFPDGTGFFVAGIVDIFEYRLTTPWDISTAEYTTNTVDVSATPDFVRGISFNNDGTGLYMMSDAGFVSRLSMSTPYTLTGTSLTTNLLDLPYSGSGIDYFGIAFDTNGTKLFTTLREGDSTIQQYDLDGEQRFTGSTTLNTFTVGDTATVSPGYNLTIEGDLYNDGSLSGPYSGLVTLASTSGSIGGSGNHGFVNVAGTYTTASTSALFTDLTVGSGGSYTAPSGDLTVTGDFDASAGTFDANSGTTSVSGQGTYNLELTYLGATSTANQENNPRDTFISPDGALLYTVHNGGDVYQYSLGTPWDITSASFVQATNTDSGELERGLYFKPDGTRFYTAGLNSAGLWEYSLSTPWDISTAAFVAATTTDIAANAEGLSLSPDGRYAFVVSGSGFELGRHILSTPWDITTAGPYEDYSMSPTNNPEGLAFTPDGRSLTLIDSNVVYLYELSTAWDASTASLLTELDATSTLSFGSGLAVSSDGRHLYIADEGTEEVHQYDIASQIATTTSSNAFNNLALTGGDVTFTGPASTTGTMSIDAGVGTTTFNASSTYTFTNINWSGASSTSLTALVSSASGTAWYLDVDGAQETVEFLFVADSDASSSASTIVATDSTDAGRNVNWSFVDGGVEVEVGGVTVTGTLYANDGLTALGAGATITAAVGTSTPSLHSTTTAADGSFTITDIATSTIGAWATSSFGTGSNVIERLAYGNGLFVAVARLFGSDVMYYSYDGLSWSSTAIDSDMRLQDVVYGNGLFVAVGGEDNGANTVAVSSDGINWTTSIPLATNNRWEGVAYGNGRFVAVGDCDPVGPSDCAMYSDDGVNWTATPIATDEEGWVKVAYGDGTFVAVSNGGPGTIGTIGYSSDGVSWATTSAPGGGIWFRDITYGDGLFVAVGRDNLFNGVVATSSDGQNWAQYEDPSLAEHLNNIAYANGQFIITSSRCEDVGYTVDDCVRLSDTPEIASSWATSSLAATTTIASITYGAGRWILLSTNDEVHYADAGFGADTPITLFVDANATTSSTTATTLTYGVNGASGGTINA
ncbi:MAG TPA: hypothetical protein VKP88_06295, partial [Candidatus Paceibacterota bacterium]|nr:hypothetical protein [Candidatus Paceibacterota bacterium]